MIGKILGNGAFWIVNKHIAKATSIEAALMLADLADKAEYFNNRGETTDDGFFFNTADSIADNTGLSYHLQKKALKLLTDAGFIETKLKGVPAKLHFKIVENKILNFLNTGIKNIPKQVSKDFKTNKNKTNNNKPNNIVSQSAPKAQTATPKEQQDDLFGKKPNANKSTLFKNSAYFEISIFKTKLKEHAALGVDIEYYHRQINNWSEASNKKRTARGWVATARTWMERDKDKNQLRLEKSDEQIMKGDADMQAYLKM